MDNTKLLRIGFFGAVVVALCCFTPILVVLLGVVGLSAITGYLDYVLLPALALFLGIVAYATFRKHPSPSNMACGETAHKDEESDEKG